MQIGILAVQGAFIEHAKMLSKLGVDSFEIRKKADFEKPMDGLILPGGESTTMFKLLNQLDLFEDVKVAIESGLPVFGTCAGLLLMAQEVNNHTTSFMKTMNIKAKKNAYGRQLGSFTTTGIFANKSNVPFVFIRAPYIEEAGDDVEVLAVHDNLIIAARENNQLVTAFHPELTNDTTVHQYFINMIK